MMFSAISASLNQRRDARRRRRVDRWVVALACGALFTAAVALPPDVAQARRCMDCDGEEGPGDGGGGGDGGDGGGGPPVPPVAYVKDRTVRSITIGWFAPLDELNIVEVLDGASWIEAARIWPGESPEFVESGVPADSRRCYRVKAHGMTSQPACAYTKDGLDPLGFLRSVWRVQLQLTTGDIADAGTDDPVAVSVAGPIRGDTGNTIWLDHDRDDFEPSDVHNYDLVDLAGVSELGDIESLDLFKSGTDDWCVRSVRLIVNESHVFEKTFGPPCQWITNQPGSSLAQVEHEELHAGPTWRNYRIALEDILWGNVFVLVIPQDQITGQIETRVGEALVSAGEDWDEDGNGVELFQVGSPRAHVHFDVGGPANATMDVDFDLVVGTHKDASGQWSVDVTTENVDAEVQPGFLWPAVILSAGIETNGVERQTEMTVDKLALELGIGGFYELSARFDAYGNMIISGLVRCPGYPACVPEPLSGLVAKSVTYGLADPSATWWPSNGANAYRVEAAGRTFIVNGTSASWPAPNAVGTFTVRVTPLHMASNAPAFGTAALASPQAIGALGDYQSPLVVEGPAATASYEVRFNQVDCLPGRPLGCVPK
jgi:hypothetical protein